MNLSRGGFGPAKRLAQLIRVACPARQTSRGNTDLLLVLFRVCWCSSPEENRGRGSFSAGPPRSGIANALPTLPCQPSENWHSARCCSRPSDSLRMCAECSYILRLFVSKSCHSFDNLILPQVSCSSTRCACMYCYFLVPTAIHVLCMYSILFILSPCEC